MARIVCQVLHRPERITFIWSEGSASFPPYHLRGPKVGEFRQLSGQARESLANLDGPALAQVGQQLYRAIFPDDSGAQEIQTWLTDLTSKNAVQSLEILSDLPGVPWNVVCEAGEFWSKRHNLTAGRRANPLRQVPFLHKPEILLIVDPVLMSALPEAERNRLSEFAQAKALQIVDSRTGVETALQAQPPEFIYFFCRAHKDGFPLGQDVTSTDELGRLLKSGEQNAPEPMVFLNVCRGAEDVRLGKTDLLNRLQLLGLNGLIASEQPGPAAEGKAFGVEFLTRFLYGGERLGAALRSARGQTATAGLLYSAFCPAHLTVVWEDEPPSEVLETSEVSGPLPDQPYKPLAPYDREDRALFSGRDEDVAEFTARLDRADTPLLILHGPSGVGKSSFLRAGVVPFLEDVAGFRALRDRNPEDGPVAEGDYPVLSIRATHDLAGQLAEALCAFCCQPYIFTTPGGKNVSVDLPAILGSLVNPMSTAIQVKPDPAAVSETPQPPTLAAESETVTPRLFWEAMQNDLGLLAHLLTALSEPLPHELVILIEQGEEVFTQATRPVDRRRRRQALQMLTNFTASSGQCKMILSIRTEFLGRLLEELPWNACFLLRELTDDEIVEAIVLPTTAEPIPGSTEVPNQKYQFLFEEGVPQAIVKSARESRGQESLLPQVQARCARYYEMVRGREDKVVRVTDLKSPARGEVATAMETYVDGLLDQTFSRKADRQALKDMATRLVHRESGGLLCRSLLPPQELARFWRGQTPVDQVVDQASSDKFRLLDVNQLLIGGNEGLYVSLNQDALVPVTARWSEDNKRRQFTRARLIDMLWIFIPLLFLVGAVTFYFTRQAGAGTDGKDGDEVLVSKKELKEIQQAIKQQQQIFGALAFPLYAGHMSLADQAKRNENTLRLRQLLLDYQKTKDDDLRSFEWFYLWGQAQQQRHDLFGHAGLVTSVAATADGKTIASGSLDGTVKLWDGAGGQILATLLGHKGPVHGVAFSPDGKMLVSAGADKTVQLWNVAPGKEYEVMQKPVKTLKGHTDAVLAVAFSSDKQTIASGSADKTVILWNVTAGEKQALPKEHKGAVQAVAFSPDGKTLASAGADRLVILWQVADASKQFVLEGHTGPVFAVAFSPGGAVLASGGEDKKDNVEIGLVRFWDPAKGKPLGEPVIQHSRGIFALSFMDDKALVTGGKDNLLRFWDPASSKQLGALPGHLGWVRSLALSANGKTIVSGSFDRTVKIWEGGPKVDVLRGHKDWVCAVAFSPDDRLLASGSRDGTVRIWDALSGQPLEKLENLGGSVLAVAFSPDKDNPKLAAGTWKNVGPVNTGAVKVWDLILDKNKNYQKAKEANPLPDHKGGVACLAFEKTGKRLASGRSDGAIILWDLEKGKPETLKAHQRGVRTLAFAASGKLASGSEDGTIRIWDTATGKQTGAPLDEHSGAVNSLALIDGDTSVLVSGGNDQTLKIWKGGKALATLRGHANAVSTVLFHDRTLLLASGSWDNTIKIWDLRNLDTTDERFTLTGHKGAVRSLAISSDGRTLASASNDGTVRLWRAASEKSLPPD